MLTSLPPWLHVQLANALCIAVRTGLTMLSWAWTRDQWHIVEDAWYWLHALALGEFGFWLIPVVLLVQGAWRNLQPTLLLHLLPGLLGFPALWWWLASRS